MSNTDLVSVILPFHNAEDTLARAIESIIVQTYSDWELLLIDNNSTDSSRVIAEAYTTDSRIILLDESNQGVVHAANKGLANSSGTFIARMDADDISMPIRIEKQLDFLKNHEGIDLVSGIIKYGGESSNGGFIKYVTWVNSISTFEELSLNRFVEYPIVNPSILMRRKIYEVYGGYSDGSFPEDYEYFLRLQANEVKMAKVQEVVLEWSDLPERLSRTDNKYSQRAFFEVKAKYLASWLKSNNPNFPEVYIWGGGKYAKKRSRMLEPFGIKIRAFIDTRKSDVEDMLHYSQLEEYRNGFILSYVTNWDARLEIRNYLNSNGFKEGLNYLICG